ncbi:MAG: 6,7-dimethyl-8-ribityllumazine synthase [Betaproteobacteria bacterium]|nr:6,7-dimethyl-8-ribityllumazine synthase [Betaproteobacteria bacterium]
MHVPHDADTHPGHAVGAEVIGAGPESGEQGEKQDGAGGLEKRHGLPGLGQNSFHETGKLTRKSLIAIGAVIRGETYHFEVVANESAAGIRQVALEFDVPIANAVLTTDTEQQAMARAAEKGAEAARVAVEMAELYAVIDQLDPDDESLDEAAND